MGKGDGADGPEYNLAQGYTSAHLGQPSAWDKDWLG